MKTRFLMIAAALMMGSGVVAGAQDFSGILSEIEANNTTIKALRSQADASIMEARTGIAPSDPSVEINYLWGNKEGNRLDLNVMQEFDFPTVYYWRKKVSQGECSLAEFEYAMGRRDILLEAQSICIDLVYHNALDKELERRLNDARTISDAYKKNLDKGDASILDVNKASLNLLSATKAYQENRIEIETLNSELARLNGGKEITVEENTLQLSLLPSDFEVWFDDAAASSPELRSLEAQNALAQSSVKLAVSEWLPKISLGYVSERQDGGILQGIGGGISIPLWENHGKVKAAKAKAAAASVRHEDAVNQYYNTLKNKYQRVLNLQKVSSEYRELLSGINSIDSLKKALESGAVSLVDYVLEISVWYDALVETLEAERDCKTLEAEMNSWKL